MISVALNMMLNFMFIWSFKGTGLALATAISAMVQVILVGWLLQKRVGILNWRDVLATTIKTIIASTVMGVVCLAMIHLVPTMGEGTWPRLFHLGATLGTAIAVYLGVAHLIGLTEPWQLLGKKSGKTE
jgi:putative peptidoglycan lipid II flippase